MVKKRSRRRLPRIGWREWVNLPDLGVKWIKAKVDTGAATSAVHADDVEVFKRRGKEWVRFVIHPKQRSTKRAVHTEAKLVEWRGIRSSNGQLERRPVIETTIRLGNVEWKAEVTLSNRDQMGFRMLLGRSSLHGNFLVDCSASFIGPEPLKRAKALLPENGNGSTAVATTTQPARKSAASVSRRSAPVKRTEESTTPSRKKTKKKATKRTQSRAPMFE